MQSSTPRVEALNDAKLKLNDYQRKYSQTEKNIEKHNNQTNIPNPTSSDDMVEKKMFQSPHSQHSPLLTDYHVETNRNIVKSSSDYTDAINILVMERNNLQRMLAFADTKSMQLTEQNESFIIRHDEMIKNQTEFQNNLSNAFDEIKMLKHENNAIKTEFTEIKKISSDKHNKMKECQNTLDLLESKLKVKMEECNKFKNLYEHSIENVNIEKNNRNMKVINDLKLQLETLNKRFELKSVELHDCNQKLAKEGEKTLILNDRVYDLEQTIANLKINAKTESSKLNEEKNQVIAQCENLKSEMKRLGNRNFNLPRMNEELNSLLKQKDLIISELIRKVERLEQGEGDRKGLLEKLQSDRDTITKCISQNEQLKKMVIQYQDEIMPLTKHNQEYKSESQYLKRNTFNSHISIVDLHQHLHSLMEYSQQLLTFGANMKNIADSSRLEIRDTKLTEYYNELIGANEDLRQKNIHLKDVNISLDESIDQYCYTIKQLDRSLIDSKERISFFELQRKQNDNSDESKNTSTFHEILKKSNEDKMVLTKHLEALNEEITSLKSTPITMLKSEAYATLERQYNRIKHDKNILQANIEDLYHKNILLSEECNTIGDYIDLYITKREAMKISMENICQYLFTLSHSASQLMKSVDELLQHLKQSLTTSQDPSSHQMIETINRNMSQFASQLQYNNLPFLNSYFEV